MPPIITFEHRSLRAFEAFGYAMATAGAFEVILRIALAEKKAAKLAQLSEDRREIETQKFTRGVFRASFGSLVQWVKGQYELHPHLIAGLDQAVDSRDHLAHHFWQTHLGNLASDEGVEIIGAECNLTATFLQEVADEFARVTGVNVAQYGKFISERAQALQEGHPLAPLVAQAATEGDQ